MSQENEINQSEAEILRQELDDFFDSIREIDEMPFRQWQNADKADEIMDVAYRFNQNNIMAQIRSKIKEIGTWYLEKHNMLIRQAGNDKKIAVNNWLLKNNSFLLEQINHELASLNDALLDCKSGMIQAAEYIKENSGVGGLINNALRGFNNPIDGFMGLFGQSSVDKEGELLDKNLTEAIANESDALEELIEKIDDIIINKWNNEFLGSLEEIENFVPTQAKVSQPNLKTQASPIFGFIITGIVVGVIIIAGIGLLRYFGLF